jgi:hypothetical protein
VKPWLELVYQVANDGEVYEPRRWLAMSLKEAASEAQRVIVRAGYREGQGRQSSRPSKKQRDQQQRE